MYCHWFIGILAAIAMSAPASAAGLKLFEVPADGSRPTIKVAVWYPSADPPSPLSFGAFTVSGAKDGAVSGRVLPLADDASFGYLLKPFSGPAIR